MNDSGGKADRHERKPERMSASHYTYEAKWSEEDRAFIARVKEFPALEAHGETRGGSLRALKGVIATVLKELAESGSEVPAQASAEEVG